ncbi:ABC transporter ATP-binding protein [Halalkalicoccus jeotgali]|uniref:ABC transporter n=1 Tax=Halalkalicoccus jeotgali (strain DSM 18796 / CECT 7217 / JCM 14584 / KCTC 4019 / B3) TaxID=795797 RepID=D8JB02_HALJB|nr:ABC transporter ATP-binding protein [Halalkalicoccus jeotgali]ADJ16455.1 ABC transporter related protein [Halalkalicoccus jeotgali B3]ELY41450.1 ABC transporter [Halalkalicoccus jeotgali B3]
MAAIELDAVTKQYNDVTALQECNLTVEEGEVYGFLGPNGAGKSTTINILLDFIRPTAGRVQVLGHDAQKETQQIHERVGVLPEGFSTYGRLTGRQHLNFAIGCKQANDDPDALAERVNIVDALDRRASGYSKGMSQRLVLAMALVGQPDLLILDEPSTGLDPAGTREMREIIREEQARGATVLFSSHILDQVESVCDRVGILHDGGLVAEDTVEGLREAAQAEAMLHIEVEHLPDNTLAKVRSLSGVSEVSANGTTIHVSCGDSSKTAVLTTLDDVGTSVIDITTEDASLEELFMNYTAKQSSQSGKADPEARA